MTNYLLDSFLYTVMQVLNDSYSIEVRTRPSRMSGSCSGMTNIEIKEDLSAVVARSLVHVPNPRLGLMSGFFNDRLEAETRKVSRVAQAFRAGDCGEIAWIGDPAYPKRNWPAQLKFRYCLLYG